MKNSKKVINNKSLRVLLVCAGFLSVGLGVLGIFLPLLPTVPLLLLALACFARSSERFYGWLINHQQLGPLIQGYVDGQGVPLRAKIIAIAMIWVTIPISAFFFIPVVWVKVLLIAIGLCVTVYLMRLPLREESVN